MNEYFLIIQTCARFSLVVSTSVSIIHPIPLLSLDWSTKIEFFTAFFEHVRIYSRGIGWFWCVLCVRTGFLLGFYWMTRRFLSRRKKKKESRPRAFSGTLSNISRRHFIFFSTEFSLFRVFFACYRAPYLHSRGSTGFYWVFLGFPGFHSVLLGFTGFHSVLLGFTGFYYVSLGFTRSYWVLLGFT